MSLLIRLCKGAYFMEKNQKSALLFGLLTVLLWSTVASAFKLTLRYFDPIQLLLYASITSFFVLLVILFFQKKIKLLFTCKARDYMLMTLLGLVNPFMYYLILFKAYDLLPAQEAQPINYTWALTLSYLSVIILKHSLRKQDVAAGILCYIGIVVIVTHGDISNFSFSNLYGVLLALLSTLLWAFYWLYNTKLSVDPIVGLFFNFAIALPLIFIWALFFSEPFALNVYGVLGSIYVGIFEMGLTFVLWLKAMKLSTNASQVANLIFISPFISLLLIALIVGETILFSTFIGLLFIIIGLLVQQIKEKEER